MSCQICVEVCPFEAIKMDKDFRLSKRERSTRCFFGKKSCRSRTSIITESIRSKRRRWTRTWQRLQLPRSEEKSSGRGSSCETRNTDTADPTSSVDIGRG